MSTIHFISDLHLCQEQPHLLRLFNHYLENIATAADAIYILGDLFEVWVGDDYQPDWVRALNQKLQQISANTPVFFCHGNRDFLVSSQYANQVGMTLLDEFHTLPIAGVPTLLCHGDSLCTDDIAYQNFRAQVRTPEWQATFLAQPIANRLAIVEQYRAQSKAATAAKNLEIMDVNSEAINQAAQDYQCQLMIHGHTHRPAQHETDFGRRLVLSDWREQGHYLAVVNQRFTSVYFDLNAQYETDWTG